MARYDVRSLYEETFGPTEKEQPVAPPVGSEPLGVKKYNVHDLYAKTFGQPRTEQEDIVPLVNRWAAGTQADDPERIDKAHRELRAYLGENTPPAGLLTLQQADERLRVAQMDHATQGAPYTAKWAIQRAGENRVPYDLPGLAKVEKSYGALLKDFLSKPIVDTGSKVRHDTTSPLYNFVAGPGAGVEFARAAAPEAFMRVVQAAPSDIFAVGPLRLLSGFQGAYTAILENSVPANLLNLLAKGITGTDVISAHHELGSAIGRLAEDIADDIPEDASLTERGFRSGFQSMGQTLPLLLSAPLAGKSAVNLFSGAMGASVGGQTYLRNYEKYQDPQRAALHGILDGVSEYVFERLGGEAVLLDKAAWAKGFFGGLAKFIAREVPSEMATTFTQNVNDWALMNPEKSVEQFLSEQGDAQIETVIATLVGGGGQVAVVKGIEAAANAVGGSAQANREERQISELFAASTEARLFNADPEAFDAFMQGISDDASVHIDATVLSQALESAGVDPSLVPSALEQGDLPGEIEVPITELVKAFAGTPAEAEIIQNLRLDPEAQTIKERRDLGDRALEEFKRIGSKTLEAKKVDDRFTGSLAALREEIQADLEATGVYKPGATSAFAEAVSLTYATTAARMGVTPIQLRDGWTDAKGVQHRGYNLLAKSEKAGEVRREAPAATKADFTPGRVQNILRRGNWAVITAENPKGVTISPEENAARNELLRAELQARGLRFQEATGKELITEQVVGKYVEEGQEKTAPLEHPFLVLGLDSATALEIGRKFEQDSVITKDGLIFHDGTRYAPENVTEHTEEPANYWTRVPSTGAMFTINLDFSAKVPWEKALANDFAGKAAAESAKLDYEKERDFAKRIISGEKTVEEFEYYDEYVRTIDAEVSLLPEGKGKLLFVGSGPVPLSPILFARHGFDVTGLDISPEAKELGEAVAKTAGVTMPVVVADATTFDFSPYDAVVLALEAGADFDLKVAILQQLNNTLPEGATLLLRSSKTPEFVSVSGVVPVGLVPAGAVATWDGQGETVAVKATDALDQRTSETVMAEALEVMRKIGEIPPGEQTAKKEKLNAKFQKLIAERKKRMDAEYEAARQGSLFQSAEGLAPVSATGIHFSQEKRNSLAPSAYGSGIDGAERERVLSASDPRIKRRSHFYVNTGMGVFPETGVGGFAHASTLTNLYDVDVDALGLFKGKTAAALNAAESGVLDAGYSGYLMRSFGNQGAAVVFQPSSIDATYVGGVKEAVAAAGVVPEPKFSETQKLKQSIMANARKLPGGMVSVERWDRMLKAILPEQHAVLKAGGVFDRAQGELYLDELLRFVEPPAGSLYQRVGEDAVFDAALAKLFRKASRYGTKYPVRPDELRKAARESKLPRGFTEALEAAIPAGASKVAYEDLRSGEPPASPAEPPVYYTKAQDFDTQIKYKEVYDTITTNTGHVIWRMWVDGVMRPTEYADGTKFPGSTTADVARYWQWFGDSVEVDSFGRPTVAYGDVAERDRASAPVPDHIDVDGVLRPTLNNRGQRIHPTDEGIRAFWRWFGDSAAVTSTGLPILLYHGTAQDFDTFALRPDYRGVIQRVKDFAVRKGWLETAQDGGIAGALWGSQRGEDMERLYGGQLPNATDLMPGHIWLTSSPELASRYAKAQQRKNRGGNVMPVYAKLAKPVLLNMHTKKVSWPGGEGEVGEAFGNTWKQVNHLGLALKEKHGADSVAARNVYDDPLLTAGGSAIRKDDIYIVESPTQIKSAVGNVGTFDPADPNVLRQSVDYFSPLARAFENAKQESMPAGQWASWLNGNKAKLGLKDDEIEATGILDYLELRGKDKVTKAEIADYLAGNGVVVNTVEKGRGEEGDRDDAAQRIYGVYYDELLPAEREKVHAEIGTLSPTKFSDYWDSSYKGGIPGSYRETLVTLPATERTRKRELEDAAFDAAERGDKEEFKRLKAESAKIAVPTNFKSGHWEEPNVLVHNRWDLVTDENGDTWLRLGEIQSDWGQKGKKEGFGDNQSRITEADGKFVLTDAAGKVRGTYDERWKAEHAQQNVDIDTKPGVPPGPFVTDTKAWVALGIKQAIRDAIAVGAKGVVFGTGEQNANLYDLSKQVSSITYDPVDEWLTAYPVDSSRPNMEEAVPRDKLADVIGKEPADKIEKAIAAAEYDRQQWSVEEHSDPDTDETFFIVINPNGEPNYAFGGELERFDSEEEANTWIGENYNDGEKGVTISGLDLKVGGEGMRAFYDKIVPQVANDVLRKLGGGKVGTVEILAQVDESMDKDYGTPKFDPDKYDMDDEGRVRKSQPGFEIPDSMREALATRGIPLFQNQPGTSAYAAYKAWVEEGKKGQPARGEFRPETLEYNLLAKADLSTFMHEMAHFYLTMQADLALQIEQRVLAGEEISAGEQSILDDMNTVLEWMGVTASTPADGSTGGALDQLRGAEAYQSAKQVVDLGKPVRNPSGVKMRALADRATDKSLRGILDEEGNLYVWDAYLATHKRGAEYFGVAYDFKNRVHIRPLYDGVRVDGDRELTEVFRKKYGSDPQTYFNVAGMDVLSGPEFAESGGVLLQRDTQQDRIARAKALGFDTEDTLYHWSPTGTFEQFSPFQHFGTADAADSRYMARTAGGKLPAEGTVFPVWINKTKVLKLKEDTGSHDPFQLAWSIDRASRSKDKLFQNLLDGALKRMTDEQVTRWAEENEYDYLLSESEGMTLDGMRELMWLEFHEQGNQIESDGRLGTYYSQQLVDIIGAEPLLADVWAHLERKGVTALSYTNAVEDPGSVSYIVPNPENVRSVHANFTGDGAVDMLAQDGAQPQAAGPLPAGASALEVWSKMSLEQQRPFHEKYAETFEQYLLTGKAPTKKLESLFKRLADWMRRVYLDMKRFLQQRNLADLNPEISAVFDRLVATEQEIAEAIAQREHEALFKNAVEAGMTPEQYAKYIGLPDDAKLEAEAQLRARSMRDMKWMQNRRNKTIAALQADAKEKRAAIKAEVRAEVEQEPIFQAIRWLRHGIMVNPDTKEEIQALKGHKLHAPALAEMFPEGAIEGAPDWKKLGYGKYGMLSAEGIHPDMLAEMFGYRSGQELVGALLNAPNIKDEIEGITDQRMLERYGDLATPEGIAKAADEAMVNDVRLRMLATELSRLAAHLGSPAAIMRAAKAYAKVLVDSRAVKKLKPRAYSADATRAGKQATAAWAKGDAEQAAAFKRTEILNHVTAAEAYEAEKEIKKITDRLTKIAGVKDDDSAAKSRNMDVVNATRVVLASFGFGNVKKGENAKQYLEALKAIEPEIGVLMEELVLVATTDAKNWRNLTVAELRDLHAMVGGVWQLAKRSREIEIDGKRISREAVADELVARAQAHDASPAKNVGAKHAITAEEERKNLFSTLKAQFRRVSDWAEAIDGGKTLGPFRRYVWFPIKTAADRYRADKVRVLKAYRDLIKPLSKEFGKGLIDAPELDYVFGKGDGVGGLNELLHAILHTGNESNKRKLLLGRGWAEENEDGSLDTSKWDKFIARMHREGKLNKDHYDFAQGVWNLLESTKVNAQKAHRAVFGKSFAEVTADAFTTPFGTYAGGYVPAMADSRIVQDAQLRALANQENENMTYAMPTPARGFTMSRVEYNRPLLLDLRTLAGHLDKVLLFSHLAEPAADVRRILMDKRVSAEINRIDSAALTSMLTPWLSRAAKQIVEVKKPGAEPLGRFWSAARSNAGTAAMFANVVNTTQQITGFATALGKMGPKGVKYLLQAHAQYLANPMAATKFVTENSVYIAERIQQGSMAMTGEVTEILINPNVYQSSVEWTRRHAYFMQTAVDGVMSPIIWLGAYQQAMDKGTGHADAARLGDEAVRQTQGSQMPEEIANFEVGSPFYRMFIQFAGYFNAQANWMGTEFSKVAHEMGLRKGLGRGFYVLVLGMLVPAIVGEMIVQAFRGGPDDEDKDGEYLDDWLSAMFVGTARYVTAMFPAVGPTIMALANTFNHKPYDDRISTAPAISMVETSLRAPLSVYKAWAEDETGKPGKAIMDTATAVSMLVGVPVRAIAKPIAYAADVEAGYIEPVDGMDYTRGLITGFASPESKQ